MKIGRFELGESHPPMIIGKAGINHDGDADRAADMVRAAKAAGCDGVLFPIFRAEEIIHDPDLTRTYRSQGREVTETLLSLYRRCELAPRDIKRLKTLCHREGMAFIIQLRDRPDLDVLLDVGADAVKVLPDDLADGVLLRTLVETEIPLILSCAPIDLADANRAVDIIATLNARPAALMYGVPFYPTPPDEANLDRLPTLRATFPGLPIGFSDSTAGPLAGALAVMHGASLLEKRFTLDTHLCGPDHWYSENPSGLAEWAAAIRTAHRMRGEGLIRPSAAERAVRAELRRVIVAFSDIAVGEELNEGNIGLRSVGDGLPTYLLEQILGKKAIRPVQRGEALAFGDFR